MNEWSFVSYLYSGQIAGLEGVCPSSKSSWPYCFIQYNNELVPESLSQSSNRDTVQLKLKSWIKAANWKKNYPDSTKDYTDEEEFSLDK